MTYRRGVDVGGIDVTGSVPPNATKRPTLLPVQGDCILRVSVGPDGSVQAHIDKNALYDVEKTRDLVFLLGCMRQLEHVILTVFNERENADG